MAMDGNTPAPDEANGTGDTAILAEARAPGLYTRLAPVSAACEALHGRQTA